MAQSLSQHGWLRRVPSQGFGLKAMVCGDMTSISTQHNTQECLAADLFNFSYHSANLLPVFVILFLDACTLKTVMSYCWIDTSIIMFCLFYSLASLVLKFIFSDTSVMVPALFY